MPQALKGAKTLKRRPSGTGRERDRIQARRGSAGVRSSAGVLYPVESASRSQLAFYRAGAIRSCRDEIKMGDSPYDLRCTSASRLSARTSASAIHGASSDISSNIQTVSLLMGLSTSRAMLQSSLLQAISTQSPQRSRLRLSKHLRSRSRK